MGAKLRSVNYLELSAGVGTVRLEHPSDSVYYVLAGSGQAVGDGTAEVHEIIEGSMVHVDRGTGYRFEAGADGMTLFGGPCPADPAMYHRYMQP
jgi:mannose-6-phosphate isomerase-like protein (cupin superfamily)